MKLELIEKVSNPTRKPEERFTHRRSEAEDRISGFKGKVENLDQMSKKCELETNKQAKTGKEQIGNLWDTMKKKKPFELQA